MEVKNQRKGEGWFFMKSLQFQGGHPRIVSPLQHQPYMKNDFDLPLCSWVMAINNYHQSYLIKLHHLTIRFQATKAEFIAERTGHLLTSTTHKFTLIFNWDMLSHQLLTCDFQSFGFSVRVKPRFHWRYGSFWYGTVSYFLRFHCQKGTKYPCHTYFGHPFIGCQVSQRVPRGRSRDTAVLWLQAGKKLFWSLVVELLLYHFIKFYIFF